jgi:putative tryptophan/tyrosine transport system substrate-binding protein
MRRVGRASDVSRRRFLRSVGTLGVALAAGCAPGPLTVAPPTPRLRRIGLLISSNATGRSVESFRRALGDLGYVEGLNFAFDLRDAQNLLERLPALAAELVEARVDVIVTIGNDPPALAAKSATSTIPIVFAHVGNVVAQGLVSDVARPGGNLTGVANLGRWGKQLELLKETVPGLVRLAHLGDARAPDLARITRVTLEDCETLGLECLPNTLSSPDSPDELEAALQSIQRARPDGLFVWLSSLTLGASGLDRVIAFAIEHRLPQLFLSVDSARRGGLIGMQVNLDAGYRIVARQVDRILRGANPGDLPVEENSFFDIVLNRSMARKIGVTFPNSVLLRAAEMID